uniref:Uncharacterized protein n=1 Tax=Myotis myotis TaxID=51298 RepID=A0A7J7WVX2_MYOMY|nr:hypothetical protein mMyoMyo1_011920 [Myotis myotis]
MPVVKVGVGIPQKWTFLVNNAVQMLCLGDPRTWLVDSLPVPNSVWFDVERDEWLTFARQDPQRGHCFQLSCLCENPLRGSLCTVMFHVLRRDSLGFPPLQQTPGLLHGIQGRGLQLQGPMMTLPGFEVTLAIRKTSCQWML